MFIKSIRAPSHSSSDYGKSDNEKIQHTPIKMNGPEVPYAICHGQISQLNIRHEAWLESLRKERKKKNWVSDVKNMYVPTGSQKKLNFVNTQ